MSTQFKRLLMAVCFAIAVSGGVMLSDQWRGASTGTKPAVPAGTVRVREVPDSDRMLAKYFKWLAAGIGAGVGMYFFSRKYMPEKKD
jgi:hypothetical protein